MICEYWYYSIIFEYGIMVCEHWYYHELLEYGINIITFEH